MRTLCLLALVISSSLVAQEHPLPLPHREAPYDLAPRFPGGPDAMMRYFADSMRYPEPERSKGLHGNVLVAFTVNTDGTISAVRGVNGLPGAPGLMREALRLVETMPRWMPATKNGHPVVAEVNTSVRFPAAAPLNFTRRIQRTAEGRGALFLPENREDRVLLQHFGGSDGPADTCTKADEAGASLRGKDLR